MEMEQSFVEQLETIYGKANLEVLERAFRFADKKHKDTTQ